MRLNHRSAPLRFIVGLMAGWTGLRVALALLPTGTLPPTPVAVPGTVARTITAAARRDAADVPAVVTGPVLAASAVVVRPRQGIAPQPAFVMDDGPHFDRQLALAIYYGSRPGRAIPASFVRLLPDRPAPPPFVPAPPVADEARWSGWAYTYLRQGSGTRSLAPGQAQLGGSQAAARIAYRLAPRLSAAARVGSALEDRAGEAAAGLEWQAHPAVRVVAERRIALDRGGRSAWSAYAAGGFTRQRGAITIDGYAQAGIVGARSGDLFLDGAVRGGTAIGPVQVGGGLWAAAQPGAARVDIGPRLAARLGDTPLTLAVERRVRVAGDAMPGSGFALTVGADF